MNGTLPMNSIKLAQIKRYKPDVLYFQNLSFCDLLFLKKIKRYAKLTISQIACLLPPPPVLLKQFDLILTSDRI